MIVSGAGRAVNLAALKAAAQEAAFDARLVTGAEQAKALVAHRTPSALLLDGAAQGAEGVCQKVRAEGAEPDTPLIVFEHKLSDRAFARAYRWGADDVVTLESTAELVKRLRALPDRVGGAPPAVRGDAVVAEADETRRRAIARVLRSAGYVVRVVPEKRAFAEEIGRRSRLVVASTVMGDPKSCAERARAAGNDATWVWLARAIERDRVAASLRGVGKSCVLDVYDPPENVLFVSNDLISEGSQSRRQHVRSLFGTLVAFRPSGGNKDDYGFTYNVSRAGLYVRTLAPPPDDVLWLELHVPNRARRARMECRVAWRRELGPRARATAPPGWGVEITSMLRAGEEEWVVGCAELVAKQPHLTGRPPPVARSAGRKETLVGLPSPSVAARAARAEASAERADEQPRGAAGATAAAYPPPPSVGGDAVPAETSAERAEEQPRGAAGAPAEARAPLPSVEGGAARAEASAERADEQPRGAAGAPAAAPPPLPSGRPGDEKEPGENAARDVATTADDGSQPRDPEPPDSTASEGPAPRAVGEGLRGEKAVPVQGRSPGVVGESSPYAPAEPIAAPAPPPDLVIPRTRARRALGLWVVAAVVGLALAVGAAAVFVAVRPALSKARDAASKSGPRRTERSARPVAETRPASPPPASATSGFAAPATSVADAAAGSGGNEGSRADGGLPPVRGADDGGDGSGLNWSEGYLIVLSHSEADVYAHAVRYGSTNEKLKVKCGLRWVRLAAPGSGPRWVSAGHTVDVVCQSTTRVTIEVDR